MWKCPSSLKGINSCISLSYNSYKNIPNSFGGVWSSLFVAWGKKLLCSVRVRQWILLQVLPDSSKMYRCDWVVFGLFAGTTSPQYHRHSVDGYQSCSVHLFSAVHLPSKFVSSPSAAPRSKLTFFRFCSKTQLFFTRMQRCVITMSGCLWRKFESLIAASNLVHNCGVIQNLNNSACSMSAVQHEQEWAENTAVFNTRVKKCDHQSELPDVCLGGGPKYR